MSIPRISVVTPSLNQGKYLERTLQSVLGQKYPGLEYIVVDGGSTDGSNSILGRYAGQDLIVERQQGKGVAAALNRGFRRATGEILGWLNADDVYLPNALKIVGQIFAEFPQVEWLTSHSINITGDDRFFALQPSRKTFAQWSQLAYASPPPQHCTFWRRSLWQRAGTFLEEGNRYMDCELWLRFHEHARLYVADTVLGAWRIHPDSYSAQRLQQLHAAIREAQSGYRRKFLRGWRRFLYPPLEAYLRTFDRGLLSRLLFECYGRRHYFFTYSLRQQRFILSPGGGWMPRPWPMTIELPEALQAQHAIRS